MQAQQSTKNPNNRWLFHFGLCSLLLTSFHRPGEISVMLDYDGLTAVLIKPSWGLFNNDAQGACHWAAMHRSCMVSRKKSLFTSKGRLIGPFRWDWQYWWCRRRQQKQKLKTQNSESRKQGVATCTACNSQTPKSSTGNRSCIIGLYLDWVHKQSLVTGRGVEGGMG